MIFGGIKFYGIKCVVLVGFVGVFVLFGGVVMVNLKEWQFNMMCGVSEWLFEFYFFNNVLFGVCVVIGILVFGVMFIVMFCFCKLCGVVVEKWLYNIMFEVVWIMILVIILIVFVYLVMGGFILFVNIIGLQMIVKVIGYQWKWCYDYVDYKGKVIDKVGFMFKFDDVSNEICQFGFGMDLKVVQVNGENIYLFDVDKLLVVLVGIKICFVIIVGDVIYLWWVLVLGWKMDVIFGIVNVVWINIKELGIYCGQCVELCGQDYGFMLIVVKVLLKVEFEQWLVQQQVVSVLKLVVFVVVLVIVQVKIFVLGNQG